FKEMCFRLGLRMSVVFVSRGACSVIASLFFDVYRLHPFDRVLIEIVFSIEFLYLIPIYSAVFILKHPIRNSPNRVYAKPKYLGRAMGMFPAGYGLAMAVRLLSVLIGSLFARGTAVGDSFHATEDLFTAVSDMPTAVVTFIQLAVIAPIFEELWFRGLVMESLRPYGNGFAILISAILFGLTHSNFEQFFYATALGVFLGYIAVSTRSIVTTTIMHAMFNSISGVMVLLSADESVGDYLLAEDPSTVEVTPGIALYTAWMVLVLLLMAVGIIMLIYKLIKIKKYRVPKVQTEISSPRRWGIFLSRVTVIVMLVLAADSFTLNLIPSTVYFLLTDPSLIPIYYQHIFG
ncbi:MAG: CPBP family intramembrane metalloprotease, partial [Oscillospiraceae bacterium]|nr:CPBP family intramembrane metalloprotease [Oscillospiraceae bacterium]